MNNPQYYQGQPPAYGGQYSAPYGGNPYTAGGGQYYGQPPSYGGYNQPPPPQGYAGPAKYSNDDSCLGTCCAACAAAMCCCCLCDILT